jgi:hypothetical protein
MNQNLEERLARLEAKVDYLIRHTLHTDPKVLEQQLQQTAQSNPALIAQLKTLLQARRRMEAIKLYQQSTNSDLLTAQRFVETLDMQP